MKKVLLLVSFASAICIASFAYLTKKYSLLINPEKGFPQD